MHIEQGRVRQEAPETGRIGVAGEVELEKCWRLWREAPLRPIDAPRIESESTKVPREAAGACEDLDAEGALAVDDVVAVSPHFPDGTGRRRHGNN